ncbi:hypothetical protein ACLB1R_35890 [Escherichia coli]
MVLPALGEGTFTVVNETLDIRQTVVSTSTYHFIVDTTPPRYKEYLSESKRRLRHGTFWATLGVGPRR